MKEIKRLIKWFVVWEIGLCAIVSIINFRILHIVFFIIHYLIMQWSLINQRRTIEQHISTLKLISIISFDLTEPFLFFWGMIVLGGGKPSDGFSLDAFMQCYIVMISIILKIILFRRLNKLKPNNDTTVKV